jgi:predicted permease
VRRARPPRLARWLLRHVVTRDVRAAVLDDMDEMFARDARSTGALRARILYCRRTVSFATRFLVERAREQARPGVSATDIRLALRLLVKHPGLTVVGGIAMAFAIAVGAATFEFLKQVVYPTMPLSQGDRIVGIQLWHSAANGVEEQALFDFVEWRQQVRSVEHLGAFRMVERNLIMADGAGPPIMAAEISAAAFALGEVPAALGRTLIEADEQPAAPDVVVIGHDVWRTRFHGAPDVIGRTVQVGSVSSTVVGVMPAGFAFPRFHSLWMPLRLDRLQYGPRQGPWANIFGRLAPGVTFADAQAEMTTIGLRMAARYPATHEHIQPQVLPYGQTVTPLLQEIAPRTLLSINLFFVMLLALVSANVALLMFARAAARQNELAVRTALGATRRRIAAQLFAEALALGSVAAAAGLAAASFVLRQWLDVSRAENGGLLAFWFHDDLSTATVAYSVGLTVLGAAIAGIVPALQVTGRGLEARLRQGSLAAGGVRIGGLWTAAVIVQIATTVAFPATAYFVRTHVVQTRSVDAGFPTREYLSARLEIAPEFARDADGLIRSSFPLARYRHTAENLQQRLLADPAVVGVTYTAHLPRTHHPPQRIEVEGADASLSEHLARERVGVVGIASNYFDVIGAPPRTGRSFGVADVAARAPVAVVNESFVRRVLQARNPIGRRVRELPRDRSAAPGPWLEIVGVVGDLGVIAGDAGNGAALYRPAPPDAVYPAHIAVHVRGEAAAFSDRLRTIAAAVDPSLHLHDVETLEEIGRTLWLEFNFLFGLLVVVSATALLLSLSAIYAIMAFNVARSTREIGIRLALGADRARLATAILARPLVQIVAGVLAGAVLTSLLAHAATGSATLRGTVLVAAYVAGMTGVCLLACLAPLRRAMRIDPGDTLKSGT